MHIGSMHFGSVSIEGLWVVGFYGGFGSFGFVLVLCVLRSKDDGNGYLRA